MLFGVPTGDFERNHFFVATWVVDQSSSVFVQLKKLSCKDNCFEYGELLGVDEIIFLKSRIRIIEKEKDDNYH